MAFTLTLPFPLPNLPAAPSTVGEEGPPASYSCPSRKAPVESVAAREGKLKRRENEGPGEASPAAARQRRKEEGGERWIVDVQWWDWKRRKGK